jgi:hypothetical protein
LSFNVLVIPEDFRQDEHILKPVVEAMLRACGRAAKVRVCRDPLLGGVREALKLARLREILDRYRMVHCFLLIVDRDGREERRARLDQLERQVVELFDNRSAIFLAENAWQEIEVWVLAGLKDLPGQWRWAEVRAEANAKETYFQPYVEQRGLSLAPFGGRQLLGQEAAQSYSRIRKLCPEDVGHLEARLRDRLG